MGLAFHVMLIHLWRKWWTWNICLVHTECQHKNGVRGSSAPETKQLITRMVFHILQNSDSLHTEVTIVVQLCVLTELLNTGSIINRNVLPCDSGGTDPHNPGATSWASSHCGRAQGSDLADSITVTTHVDPCMRQCLSNQKCFRFSYTGNAAQVPNTAFRETYSNQRSGLPHTHAFCVVVGLRESWSFNWTRFPHFPLSPLQSGVLWSQLDMPFDPVRLNTLWEPCWSYAASITAFLLLAKLSCSINISRILLWKCSYKTHSIASDLVLPFIISEQIKPTSGFQLAPLFF